MEFLYIEEAYLSFMEPAKFRKLNVELPVEPITNDRPWLIAGWILALAFIIIVAYAFLLYKGLI